jgi:pathogenesis-related protein 1
MAMAVHWAMVVLVLAMSGLASAVSSEAEEFLRAHNRVRSKVDVAPLEWSEELAEYARRYGEQQRDQHQCAMVHSRGPYGENLFWGYGKPFTPTDAVRSWEDESKDYNYESNSCAPGKVCGHYTQLVWADTKRVGCAVIACHDGATFVICSYDPPGNFVGERPFQRRDKSHPAQNVESREDQSSKHAHLSSTAHDDDDDEGFNKADARLCQCILNCVSNSRSNEWRHESAARQ